MTAVPAGATGGAPRTLVCGTGFGRTYLEAFRQPGFPLQLAGILARGSPESLDCASEFGVPLFKTVDELPASIDMACVVIRSGLLGGPGTTLALELMARGIPVLQEHPVHHDELAECLRTARRNGVGYQLTTFYPQLPVVRATIAMSRALLRCQRPVYLDAACGFQVAYALLDILARMVGGVRPCEFADPAPVPEAPAGAPFRSLHGVLAGVPVTLRVHNELDAGDPDRHAHLLHRICLGTEGGNLTMLSTDGPTMWSPRPWFPRHGAFDASEVDQPTPTIMVAPEPVDYRALYGKVWPAAAGRAMAHAWISAAAGSDLLREGQYHLALCRIWQDVAARLGPPAPVRFGPVHRLSADDLRDIADAAQHSDPAEALR